jgi:hypothetical protein
LSSSASRSRSDASTPSASGVPKHFATPRDARVEEAVEEVHAGARGGDLRHPHRLDRSGQRAPPPAPGADGQRRAHERVVEKVGHKLLHVRAAELAVVAEGGEDHRVEQVPLLQPLRALARRVQPVRRAVDRVEDERHTQRQTVNRPL